MIITTEWNGLTWIHYIPQSILDGICSTGDYVCAEDWEGLL